MRKLILKYITLLIAALLLINVFRFILTVYTRLNDLDPMDGLPTYLPYAIGVFFAILMLIDRTKFKQMSAGLFIGVWLLTLLNYFAGIVLLILAVVVKNWQLIDDSKN